jgi:hypothetical protein
MGWWRRVRRPRRAQLGWWRGGYHGFGGDGFSGGNYGHSSYRGGSSWNHSDGGAQSYSQSHPSGSADYSTYNANQMAEQQSKYNEANTLQHNQEQSQEYMHNQTMNTVNNNVGNTNWNGGNPYGDCCSDGGGSSTGEVLGAAALGAVGGMAVGSMMTANAQSQAPTTTIVENNPSPYPYGPPPMGTTVYSLPPGAYPTTVNESTYYWANGVYYKPFYSGSQVVYVVSQP